MTEATMAAPAARVAAAKQKRIGKSKPNGAAPLLTREEILGAEDLRGETLPVPEWGGSVRIRVLSLEERDAFEGEAQQADTTTNSDVMARVVAMAVVDQAGTMLFTPADIPALKRKSAPAMARVMEAVLRLNAMTEADIEELAGN